MWMPSYWIIMVNARMGTVEQEKYMNCQNETIRWKSRKFHVLKLQTKIDFILLGSKTVFTTWKSASSDFIFCVFSFPSPSDFAGDLRPDPRLTLPADSGVCRPEPADVRSFLLGDDDTSLPDWNKRQIYKHPKQIRITFSISVHTVNSRHGPLLEVRHNLTFWLVQC